MAVAAAALSTGLTSRPCGMPAPSSFPAAACLVLGDTPPSTHPRSLQRARTQSTGEPGGLEPWHYVTWTSLPSQPSLHRPGLLTPPQPSLSYLLLPGQKAPLQSLDRDGDPALREFTAPSALPCTQGSLRWNALSSTFIIKKPAYPQIPAAPRSTLAPSSHTLPRLPVNAMQDL